MELANYLKLTFGNAKPPRIIFREVLKTWKVVYEQRNIVVCFTLRRLRSP